MSSSSSTSIHYIASSLSLFAVLHCPGPSNPNSSGISVLRSILVNRTGLAR